LLKLKADLSLLDLNPLSLQDFINTNDLRIFSQGDLSFVVVGFPSDIAITETAKKLIWLQPLFFLTTTLQGKQQTKAKIYLDYRIENEAIPNLPEALGLSGAGIWHIPSILPSNSIWSPNSMKLVAIQHAWKRNEYIVGLRVRKIFEWLQTK
jgi:hypothetical protein